MKPIMTSAWKKKKNSSLLLKITLTLYYSHDKAVKGEHTYVPFLNESYVLGLYIPLSSKIVTVVLLGRISTLKLGRENGSCLKTRVNDSSISWMVSLVIVTLKQSLRIVELAGNRLKPVNGPIDVKSAPPTYIIL